MKDTKSIVLDFGEKTIRKIAFARTREEAERIKQQLDMNIYYPSELADLGTKETIFVLFD